MHCLTIGRDTGLGIVFCLLEVGVTAAVVFALMRRTTVFSIEDRELAQELRLGTTSLEAVATKYARSALDAARALADPAKTRRRHDARAVCIATAA